MYIRYLFKTCQGDLQNLMPKTSETIGKWRLSAKIDDERWAKLQRYMRAKRWTQRAALEHMIDQIHDAELGDPQPTGETTAS